MHFRYICLSSIELKYKIVTVVMHFRDDIRYIGDAATGCRGSSRAIVLHSRSRLRYTFATEVFELLSAFCVAPVAPLCGVRLEHSSTRLPSQKLDT